MKCRAFTLIELLIVIAIIAILSAMLLPALAKAKRKGMMIDETSSAKQLLLAAQFYADENSDTVFPGYVTDAAVTDDQNQPLFFPENARYPWRIAPYISGSFETIYCADNRAKLSELRGKSHSDYIYSVSLYPSLGMNSYFIGGNESEFPATLANQKYGANTVVTKMNQIRHPCDLMSFVSARSAVSGLNAAGYFQVTPPYLKTRQWVADYSSSLSPDKWGFVAPRFDFRAVTAMLDGHAQTLNLRELQDMQHWCNTADRPDFIVQTH